LRRRTGCEDLLEPDGFFAGLAVEAHVSDADGGDPDGGEVSVAVAVRFELRRVGVGAVGVELDRELVLGEEDVDFVTGDPGVDGRLGESVALGELEEVPFELRACRGAFGVGGMRAESFRGASRGWRARSSSRPPSVRYPARRRSVTAPARAS
jgi:hypothetical protein